ncbi:MAG: nuclear transport factor 2 family protein [Pseudomonadota bacterium]
MSGLSMKKTVALASLLGAAFLGSGSQAQTPAAQPDLTPRIAGAYQRILAISQRADHVTDYNDLRNLQQIYGFYVDKALWDEVLDLFAEDGTLELGQNGVFVGKPAIRKYLYSLTDGKPGLMKGQLNNHFTLSPVITIAPDAKSAKARWRALIQDGIYGAGSGGNWGSGVYENEYVKQDGVWKIRTLHLFVKFYAPYEGGWTKAADDSALRYARSKVKPSKPPSVAYKPWPARFTPPFHYENPVQSKYLYAPAGPPAANGPAPKTVTDLEAQVRALELRLDRLKAGDDVENLESTYGYYADKSMQDAMSALFAENSTLEILGRGVFIGSDRVYEYMRRLGAPTRGNLYNHMQLQPVVHVAADGQSAHVRARLFVMFGGLERGAQWGEGVYENYFIRENGVWKYQNLNGFQTFYTDYEKGWAKHSSAMFSPFPGYPPDQPQSVDYGPYPAPFVPPFHYKNPVSGK